ncbi:hypothetical protein K438DRAFT_1791398 [Mycena galopus ATCC 62051]|nr:hypothetical protein K438DRAFT_1791398 [Mycena galopus ATCC 62051]
MHFYGWKRGLKTGIYYLRTQPAAAVAIQFTVNQKVLDEVKVQNANEAQAKAALKAAAVLRRHPPQAPEWLRHMLDIKLPAPVVPLLSLISSATAGRRHVAAAAAATRTY